MSSDGNDVDVGIATMKVTDRDKTYATLRDRGESYTTLRDRHDALMSILWVAYWSRNG